MYHVDNSTGVPVMPQPSPVTSETELFFTEGGNGVPPTFPGPDWFNIIQSELINILRAAGLDPDKMDNTQILAALKKLFLSRSNPFGDIKADGAAAIATALSNLGLRTAAKADVVGTVSQSGGVPTGAIIERGSNSNGEYTKFADG
ncbi:integrase, partial [Citrobacter freundii complex sp. 2024EL-00219]